jgi:hypothetical protein
VAWCVVVAARYCKSGCSSADMGHLEAQCALSVDAQFASCVTRFVVGRGGGGGGSPFLYYLDGEGAAGNKRCRGAWRCASFVL